MGKEGKQSADSTACVLKALTNRGVWGVNIKS